STARVRWSSVSRRCPTRCRRSSQWVATRAGSRIGGAGRASIARDARHGYAGHQSRCSNAWRTGLLRARAFWLFADITRRWSAVAMSRLVTFLAFSLTLVAEAGAAWPERPVRLIVPYSAGGSTDTV